MAGNGRRSHPSTTPDPHGTSLPLLRYKTTTRASLHASHRTTPPPSLTARSLHHQKDRSTPLPLPGRGIRAPPLEGRPRPCGRAALLSLSALSLCTSPTPVAHPAALFVPRSVTWSSPEMDRSVTNEPPPPTHWTPSSRTTPPSRTLGPPQSFATLADAAHRRQVAPCAVPLPLFALFPDWS